MKIFINEFVAYVELGKAIKFRENITQSNMFEAYYNGSIASPKDIFVIWNVSADILSFLKKKDYFIDILMNNSIDQF